MLNIDLSGRIALVLGGSRGIGAGIVKCLCAAGAFTFFTHTGNPAFRERLKRLLGEIDAVNGKAKDVPLDAINFTKTVELADTIASEKGRIDILVCNVGRNLVRSVEDTTIEEWQSFLDLNLSAAFYGVKAVVPHMVRQRYGRIILIGSSAVFDGGGGAADYASAKAGLVGLMKYLCRAYIRKGINTNVVHPCVIDTDLVRERYSTKEQWEKLVSQIPVGRTGTPEEVGGIVAYLASPWGDYIAGQEILLDGGRTLSR